MGFFCNVFFSVLNLSEEANLEESMAPEVVTKVEVTDSVVIEDKDTFGGANDDGINDFADFNNFVAQQSESPGNFSSSFVNGVSTTANSESPSCFFNALPSPQLEQQKLEDILGTVDPWVVYDKRNREYKHWMSVLYSVGKNIAFNCPYSDRSRKNHLLQNYFSDRCAQFMQYCWRMMPEKESRPEIPPKEHDSLRAQSIAGMVKTGIRHGFKHGCIQLDKRFPTEQLDKRLPTEQLDFTVSFQ